MGAKANTYKNDLIKLIFQNVAAGLIGDVAGLQPSATAGSLYIALHTSDIYKTVDALKVELLDTPDTYYELLDKRLPGHGEPVDELKRRRILLDGSPSGGLLLQIFTKTMIGPIFFEIIQRKGDEGFGEGNFKALFESMELDQVRRGVLKPAA